MEAIVSSVKHVADIMAEIAAASEAQNAGIQQINAAVNDIDSMTQQNAALVEQATAASESLIEQAANLRDVVEHFVIRKA